MSFPKVHPLLVLAVPVVIAFAISFSTQSVNVAERKPAEPIASVRAKHQMDTKEFQRTHRRCLTLALAGDPEQDKFVDFFDRNFFYGTITQPGSVGFDLTEGQSYGVMIVVASQEERAKNDFPSAANWQYNNQTQMLFTPPIKDYTDIWTGVRLAHELSHAMQYSLNGTMPKNPSDELLHLEEIRAHRFETRLLDQYTHGEYLKRINAWLDEQPELVPSNGWFQGADEKIVARVRDLFPDPLSRQEIASRNGSLMFALNNRLAELRHVQDFPLNFTRDPNIPADPRLHVPH